MKIRVADVAVRQLEDISLDHGFDVKDLDAAAFTCLRSAVDALSSKVPPSFSEFERDILSHFIEGLMSSHLSIRKLLADGHDSSSVDGLVIARLQLESVYTFRHLLDDAENVRLYLKNGWKKQYIRFLLHREEYKQLARAQEVYSHTGFANLERLRSGAFVSVAEREWIDFEELGESVLAVPKHPIPDFPGPMRIIERTTGDVQQLLKRLYPEYRHLCSFTHGASEATVFRALTDPRSPVRHYLEPWKIFDVGQREVAEPSIIVSVLSCVLVATEVFSAFPEDVELAVKLAKAWDLLTSVSLLAKAAWSLRARKLLRVII